MFEDRIYLRTKAVFEYFGLPFDAPLPAQVVQYGLVRHAKTGNGVAPRALFTCPFSLAKRGWNHDTTLHGSRLTSTERL